MRRGGAWPPVDHDPAATWDPVRPPLKQNAEIGGLLGHYVTDS
jgi:hypothetical protein